MTTPENFKRRQQIELRGLIAVGLAVLLVGVAQLGTYLYVQRENRAQKTCITSNFGALVESLVVRGQIAAREAKANKLESKANRLGAHLLNDQFIPTLFSAKTPADSIAAYGKYRADLVPVNTMLAKVDRRRAVIAKDRAENPIPAFPAGRCE